MHEPGRISFNCSHFAFCDWLTSSMVDCAALKILTPPIMTRRIPRIRRDCAVIVVSLCRKCSRFESNQMSEGRVGDLDGFLGWSVLGWFLAPPCAGQRWPCWGKQKNRSRGWVFLSCVYCRRDGGEMPPMVTKLNREVRRSSRLIPQCPVLGQWGRHHRGCPTWYLQQQRQTLSSCCIHGQDGINTHHSRSKGRRSRSRSWSNRCRWCRVLEQCKS